MLLIDSEPLSAIHDSIASTLPLLRELAMNSRPEPYTVDNLWWTKLNVVISIVGVVFGATGAWYGYRGYIFSRETAANVARVRFDTQMRLCRSLFMDLYRNYIRALVVAVRYSRGECASENYLASFSFPEFADIFYPDSFNSHSNAFVRLNDVKQRMDHYRRLLDVVSAHAAKRALTDRDCADLMEKPVKVMKSMLSFLAAVEPEREHDRELKREFAAEYAAATAARSVDESVLRQTLEALDGVGSALSPGSLFNGLDDNMRQQDAVNVAVENMYFTKA